MAAVAANTPQPWGFNVSWITSLDSVISCTERLMPDDATLTWDSVPARKAWSAQLLQSIASAQQQLDQGNPEQFAPGYSGLTASRQLKFWAELFVAIAHFESS